jgi:hypothetical protein
MLMILSTSLSIAGSSYTKLDDLNNELTDNTKYWRIVRDNATGLIWQQSIAPEAMTWEQSLEYCENLILGGRSDWRLPTIKELESIVDLTQYDPSINTTYFSNTEHQGYFWSSTTYSFSGKDHVRLIDFDNGCFWFGDKTGRGNFRAVCGGHSLTVDTVAKPSFSPSPGPYLTSLNVNLSCPTSDATIYYTSDGSTPSSSSAVYSSPILVNSTKTITAIATKSGMNNSLVASGTYTIGGSPCTYLVAATSRNFSVSGGNGTISIYASSPSCSWQAQSNTNCNWIHITSNDSGTGDGSISYSVDPNPNSSFRTDSIIVAGETVSIFQESLPCSYSVSPEQKIFNSNLNYGTIHVETNSNDCNWQAQSNVGWVEIKTGVNSNGDGTVNYEVKKNNLSHSREGFITINNSRVTIIQAGNHLSNGCLSRSAGYEMMPSRMDYRESYVFNDYLETYEHNDYQVINIDILPSEIYEDGGIMSPVISDNIY